MKGKKIALNKKIIFGFVVACIVAILMTFAATNYRKTENAQTTTDKFAPFSNGELIKSALNIAANGRKDNNW